MADGLMGEIVEYARNAYKDLGDPDYHFFAAALARDPWQGLTNELSAFVKVEDWTDRDNGVGFSYVLVDRHDKSASWSLWLSAVGPFAFLCVNPAHGELRRQDVLVSPIGSTNSVERQIIGAIGASGARLLDAEAVETSVDFAASDGRFPTSVFVLLFGEDDVPWWHE
jgi:hypothetical protein